MISVVASVLFWLSVAFYVVFWIWAVLHATRTPRADKLQRALWGIAMLANPTTAVWYWYIWKRWAFIALFTPVLVAFASFPLVIRSVLTKAEEGALTNLLFSLGSGRLVILVAVLMVFPLVLRLIAILDIGKNAKLTAMDRNDWIVAIALPIFGYGAAVAYCARTRKGWALVGLLWWVVILLALGEVVQNVLPALTQAGDILRQTFLRAQGIN